MRHAGDTARDMIQGALVADAAAMGLHWIYDQDHIAKIAPDDPTFVAPDAANYAGVMGYFAHAHRANGQNSQYGEQLKVMQTALDAREGAFDPQSFVTAFQAHFGYGGTYVGYIDHATRGSLDAYRAAADAAQDRGRAVPWDGDASVTNALVTKALALIQQHEGAALRTKFEEAVRITHDNDETVAYGLRVLAEISALPATTGAVDLQLPAIAKLPPLVIALSSVDDAAFTKQITAAIRLTSDHDEAVAFGLSAAQMLRAALRGATPPKIVEAGLGVDAKVDRLLHQAIEMQDKDTNAVTRHFGLACDLAYGVPSVAHNVVIAKSYSQAIRRNIYAGGDTCGRAILLGAIMGAVHPAGSPGALPQNWSDKLI